MLNLYKVTVRSSTSASSGMDVFIVAPDEGAASIATLKKLRQMKARYSDYVSAVVRIAGENIYHGDFLIPNSEISQNP